ncbi:Vacuolar protein sorting-associated protein 41 homolog [Coccomyxa sp. Obi]|nr:Vacuolar protein sorting-associated protein 41 homolog [Coccomyxa sp. Obi]
MAEEPVLAERRGSRATDDADTGNTPALDFDEAEEEPRLKYQRLGCDVAELLGNNAATCLSVSDKILALGTHSGAVHVLDYIGNEVKRIEAHKGPVNEICFDEAVEYIASCSDDGTVVIQGFYTDEVTTFKYKRPIKSVALDPRYGSRKTREFVTGGLAGQLLLVSKGWLGNKDTILHSGEGPIQEIKWSGSLISWANDLGVKVYDTTIHQRIAYIERPRSSLRHDKLQCHMFWEGDSLLHIGWADCVKVARMRPVTASLGGQTDSKHSVQIVASFQMDYLIAGIAPFGEDICLLACALAKEANKTELEGTGAAEELNGAVPEEAPRPELKIVTWQNEEVASDALSIHGYEHYAATDYALAAWYPRRPRTPGAPEAAAGTSGRSTDFTKWWADGDEPLYYIISSKDVVVGRPRDGDDRVAWLLDHKRFDKALAVLDTNRGLKASTHEQVTQRYLEHLVSQRRFDEAAQVCSRLLKDNAAGWERWVYVFAQLRQLPALAPYIPTKEPRLRQTAYEMVLHSFLLSPADHPRLLDALLKWPPDLYSVPSLTQSIINRARGPGGDSKALLQAAAHLYQLQGRFDLALAILLRLQQPDVFDFVTAHSLLPLLKPSHVAALVRIDEVRAIRLLVDHHEEVTAATIVPALQAAEQEARSTGNEEEAGLWRKRIFYYLDWLFQKDANAGADFAGVQVELYADYDRGRLMAFLVSSQAYALEAAAELCEARGLVREQVFVLGRMGNSRQALQLIIARLADIPQAIEFVQMQRDDELWELLISLAIGSADLTGALLDHIGGYVDPLRLVQKIPVGLEIPRLRDRLVHIIADFRTQTSLREGCNTILHHDCLSLAQRLYLEVRHAVRQLHVREAGSGGSPDAWYMAEGGGLKRKPVDASSLPGPWGGHKLHVQPRQAAGQDSQQLPKVWVGLAGQAPVQAATDTARKPQGRRASGRRKTGEDAAPPLPSLILGRVEAQHS